MSKSVSNTENGSQEVQRLMREMNAELIKSSIREQELTAIAEKAGQLLREHVSDVERFTRAAVGREERMIELKKEINALAVKLGEKERYKTDFDSE